MGDSPYTPAAGLGSVPNTGANPGLLEDAVSASKYDYSDVLGKLTAEKEQAAKLALVSRAHDQLDFEEAQRKADLAQINAKRAEADMHARALSDPKYLDALSAQHSAVIAESTRTADAGAAAAYTAEKEAGEIGLDKSAYTVDGKVDHLALAQDVQRLRQRNSFLSQGYSMDEAKRETGLTRQESYDVPATGDAPASDSSAPTGDLSNSPTVSPSSAPAAAASLDSLPTPGTPAALAPAPALSDGLVPPAALPEGVAPNAPTSLYAAREAMRVPIARQNKIAPKFVTDKQLDDALGVATTKEVYVDPKTQDSYEVQVTKDRTGRIYSTSTPILHERSKTQQVIDSAAAADYQDYTQNRGATRDQSDVATLDEAIKILRDPSTTGASGPVVALLPDGLRNFLVSDRSLKAPQMIKQVVQNHLKELFGSRPVGFEVKNAMELIFNPGLSEETNADTAERKRNELATALENKRDSMVYFGAHGTLEGFTPKSLTGTGATPSTSTGGASTSTAPAGTTSGRAQLGDVKYFPGNPRPYKLTTNEVNGKREWVGQ